MWRAVLATLLAAIAVTSCTNPFSTNDMFPPSRADLQKEIDKHPGIPFVLPFDIPDGYQFIDHTFSTRAVDGRTTSRGLTFSPEPSKNHPVVNFCIELVDSGAEICNADRNGDTAQVVTRRHLNLVVSIYLSKNDPAAKKVWLEVRLTTELDAVTWL